MNVLRIAAQNVRALWKHWFGLTVLLALSVGLCLAASGVTDNISAASNSGILESTANRSILVQRDNARPESKILSTRVVDELGRLNHVKAVEPRVQTSFGYKGPGVPGVLLYATLARSSYLPPLVGSVRASVFPLAPGEIVLPRIADGSDLSRTLGKRITVELTRRTGTNEGVGVQRNVRVVGLFDPSWQLDGRSAAYAAQPTVTKWAALDAGIPPSSYLDSVGYDVVSVITDTSADVPAAMDRIQQLGYSASSLQQQLEALPVVLSLVKMMSRILLVVVAMIALIGAFTMSSALVRQRTREIGVCKACGFDSTAMFGIFLSEALCVTVAATVAGLLLGIVGTVVLLSALRGLSGVADYLPHVFALPGPGAIVTIALIALVVTGLGAMLPARRASRMDPVQAIGDW